MQLNFADGNGVNVYICMGGVVEYHASENVAPALSCETIGTKITAQACKMGFESISILRCLPFSFF